MNTAALKLDLVKKILNTEDKEIINHIKAIFSVQNENWFEELPAEIKVSVNKSLKQAAEGKIIPHEKVMKKYRK